MARIAGVNLPKNKRIQIALTEITGIGKSLSTKMLNKLGIDLNKKAKDLTENELAKLRDEISKLTIEGDLRRKQSMDIKRLQEIGSYRGFRHKKNLPVHGQKTQTNCRTKKGKKKTVANKKKVAK